VSSPAPPGNDREPGAMKVLAWAALDGWVCICSILTRRDASVWDLVRTEQVWKEGVDVRSRSWEGLRRIEGSGRARLDLEGSRGGDGEVGR
jgi:hypothetical protein